MLTSVHSSKLFVVFIANLQNIAQLQKVYLPCQIKHQCKIVLLFLIYSHSVLSTENDNLIPLYVKPITNPYEQYNDINPVWSNDGEIISFERYDMNSHNIVLSDKYGRKSQIVTSHPSVQTELDLLLFGNTSKPSFNTGLSWSPDNRRFVYVSTGDNQNFDLYVSRTHTTKSRRLTYQNNKDAQANWSPINEKIVFVSSRTNNADLYLIDQQNSNITLLLKHEKNALFPIWSPDAKRIAFMLGESNTYKIHIINNIGEPGQSLQLISPKKLNSIRPSWSPDGNKIAFYSQKITKHNIQWEIIVVEFKVNDLNFLEIQKTYSIVDDAIKNSRNGPTWTPDSEHIAYIRLESSSYNPIYIININTLNSRKLATNTTMNLDLSCSSTGVLAFQAQDRQWNRIYVAALPDNWRLGK